MKNNLCKVTILVLLISIVPAIIYSQITTKQVKFPIGKSSTTINSVIKGNQTIDYVVSLAKGQELKVGLETKNLSCYFNIMAPAATEEAFYNSSINGNNYKGIVTKTGKFKIRVYLYRNAARRNEAAAFALKIAATVANSKPIPASVDAKVKGTNYHANGDLRAIDGSTKTRASFGVIRFSGGNAEVHTKMIATGHERILLFTNGKWSCKSNTCNVVFKKSAIDEWEVIVNNKEHYFITEAVVYGG